MVGSTPSEETLDKELIHVLEGMERDGVRFPHVSQNGVHFKAYELFLSGIFLPTMDRGWLSAGD